MSSRLVVLAIPFVVIAIFWLMARYEGRLRHDPTHKGYFERNGMVLGIMFIVLLPLVLIMKRPRAGAAPAAGP